MCVIFLSYPGQAAVGNLAHEVNDLKASANTVRQGGGLSAAAESAELKVEIAEVPPKILRSFQSGLKKKVILDPTVQCTGQNKKENVQTFSIAKQSVIDGCGAAKAVLRMVMPIDQANRCMAVYSPKIGVSAQKLS